jgi:hypothetical protein
MKLFPEVVSADLTADSEISFLAQDEDFIDLWSVLVKTGFVHTFHTRESRQVIFNVTTHRCLNQKVGVACNVPQNPTPWRHTERNPTGTRGEGLCEGLSVTKTGFYPLH